MLLPLICFFFLPNVLTEASIISIPTGDLQAVSNLLTTGPQAASMRKGTKRDSTSWEMTPVKALVELLTQLRFSDVQCSRSLQEREWEQPGWCGNFVTILNASPVCEKLRVYTVLCVLYIHTIIYFKILRFYTKTNLCKIKKWEN